MSAQINKSLDLGRVVMPLVKVLRDGQLSWSDREEIAMAILAAWRSHREILDESAKHVQAGLQGGAQQGMQGGIRNQVGHL